MHPHIDLESNAVGFMLLAIMVLSTTGFYESTKNVGSSRRRRRRRRRDVVGIPLPAQVVIGVPGKRLAITFSLINIFACGFLQRVKHRLGIILYVKGVFSN